MRTALVTGALIAAALAVAHASGASSSGSPQADTGSGSLSSPGDQQAPAANQQGDGGRSPFVRRFLKLARALRSLVAIDADTAEEMRSAAEARAAAQLAAAGGDAVGANAGAEEHSRATWFGVRPRLSAAGSSWFPVAALFRGEKGLSSPALLPISPVDAGSASSAAFTKSAVIQPPRDRPKSEMPDPDATGWFGVPVDSQERDTDPLAYPEAARGEESRSRTEDGQFPPLFKPSDAQQRGLKTSSEKFARGDLPVIRDSRLQDVYIDHVAGDAPPTRFGKPLYKAWRPSSDRSKAFASPAKRVRFARPFDLSAPFDNEIDVDGNPAVADNRLTAGPAPVYRYPDAHRGPARTGPIRWQL